jgi:hypothetical protein
MEEVELTNLTVGTHQKAPLNIDFGSDNERQDYKIDTVGEVVVGGGG